MFSHFDLNYCKFCAFLVLIQCFGDRVVDLIDLFFTQWCTVNMISDIEVVGMFN